MIMPRTVARLPPLGMDADMLVRHTVQLFAWDQLEDSPSLTTLREFLRAIPDGKLLAALRAYRGHGRDDYPVGVLWGTVLLTIALRHPSFEACLGELRRNAALRRLIGIAPSDHEEDDVPKGYNISRFLEVLGLEPHRTLLHECFDEMIQRLGTAVPDLGRRTAGDSSTLNARAAAGSDRNPSVENEKIELDEHGLPQPAGGRKEYQDESGSVVKVVEWFGYKFHLLVDTKHEVVLAWEITSTKTADSEVLPRLVKNAKANMPEERMETLTYDKACDTNEVHEVLAEEDIKPVIETRKLWQNQVEQKLPGHGAESNVVFDEMGTLFCYDTVSQPPVRHRMSYTGHESSRGTLKYRCPAKHEGWRCPMSPICNAGKSYGMTVRVRQEIDLRRFPPIPRATKQFERLYNGRTSVERVNARLKLFWGADDGNITGAPRFFGFLSTVMIVHAGFATLLASAPRRQGTLSKVSLHPIAKALRDKIQAELVNSG